MALPSPGVNQTGSFRLWPIYISVYLAGGMLFLGGHYQDRFLAILGALLMIATVAHISWVIEEVRKKSSPPPNEGKGGLLNPYGETIGARIRRRESRYSREDSPHSAPPRISK